MVYLFVSAAKYPDLGQKNTSLMKMSLHVYHFLCRIYIFIVKKYGTDSLLLSNFHIFPPTYISNSNHAY